jgi:acyl carrier protein
MVPEREILIREVEDTLDGIKSLRQIIAEVLGISSSEISNSSSFVDDLGMDSMDAVELVMILEEEFQIEISEEDAEKMETVQDAIDYLRAHSKGRK